MENHNCRNFDFDIALSFAGEDRKYVEQVASFLQTSGFKVFYDKYEKVNLWGKDLYQHLDNIYQKTSKYVVMFISKSYEKKLWTNHELKSSQARAFSESEEYILPARFDDTEIPGIRKTIGYINLNEYNPSEFAKLIIEKLSKNKPENVLPSEKVRLKQLLNLEGWEIEADDIDFVAFCIFTKLKLLSQKEKYLIGSIIFEGCEHDLPKNIHIELKVLERQTKMTREEIMSNLNGITGIGFDYKIKLVSHGTKKAGNYHKEEMICLSLHSLTKACKYDNIILFLAKMMEAATYGKCIDCSFDLFVRLDFSDLGQPFTDEELAEISYELNSDFSALNKLSM